MNGFAQIPYWYFKSALTDEQCNMIIEKGMSAISLAKQKGENVEGSTFGDTHKKDDSKDAKPRGELTLQGAKKKRKDNTYIRDSKIGWLSDQEIYGLINPFVTEANERAGWLFDVDWVEPAQFTTYGEGGFYSWHKDSLGDHNNVFKPWDKNIGPFKTDASGNPILNRLGEKQPPAQYTSDINFIGKVRKLSVTVNLTNPKNYSGGNLKFDLGPHAEKRFHTATEARPRGSIIVFPSYLEHTVTPIKKGNRYSLVMWFLGRPFR